MKQKIKTTVIAYLFIFPSLLGIVVFYIVPYIICLIKSLYAGQEFVGLKNYIQLFSNNTFLLALKNTAIFTFTAIVKSQVKHTKIRHKVYRWFSPQTVPLSRG